MSSMDMVKSQSKMEATIKVNSKREKQMVTENIYMIMDPNATAFGKKI